MDLSQYELWRYLKEEITSEDLKVIAKASPVIAPALKVVLPISIVFWLASLFVAHHSLKRFYNLKNYSKTIERLESKTGDLEQTLELASSSN